MKKLLQLPEHLLLNYQKNEYFLQVPKRKHCFCGGVLHIHTSIQKKVKIMYLLLSGNIIATVQFYYYLCTKCRQYVLDDGGLGIQHATTLNYRKAICQIATISTFADVAKLTNNNASTIRNWSKQLFI